MDTQTPAGWTNQDNQLTRSFTFDDFKSSLAFVNRVGELAETANHHPDIELGWGRAVIHLTTHDTGGISNKDYRLAEQINQLTT